MINRPDNHYTYMFGGLFLLHAFALLYLASAPRFSTSYENEIIEVASRMAATGEWGIPRLESGEAIYPIPPLAYWFSAAGHWLLPGSRLGYRLFSIIAHLLGFCGFFYVTARSLDARTSFYSSCIIASGMLVTWQAQSATPESLGALFICAALAGFYLYLTTAENKYFWLIYLSLAAALLSKGLVAVILPLIILVIYLMFRIKMNAANLKKIQIGKGLLLSFMLGLPWFLYAAIADNSDWILHFADSIHWLQKSSPRAQDGAFYLPFIFIIITLIPFGFFLPKSFGYSWKFRHRKSFMLLSAISLLVFLLFFAFSESFLPDSLLPAIPFAAVLIAYQLSQLNGRPLSKMRMYIGVGGIIAMAVFLPMVLFYALNEGMGEGTERLYYIIMLAVLPAGSLIALLLWQMKRTDEGMIVLTITYMSLQLFLIQAGVHFGFLRVYLLQVIS